MTAPSVLGASLLFCPGNMPERFRKALDAADVAILDLEDGVAPDDKADARQHVRVALDEFDSARIVVRINPPGSADGERDLEALSECRPRAWMLAKAQEVGDMDLPGGRPVIASCETAMGVHRAADLAEHPHCEALFWGSEDLIVDLRGGSSRGADGRYVPILEHARAQVLLGARTAGKDAIDSVHVNVADRTVLQAEAVAAARMGFTAKAAVHPAQIPVIRSAFRPSPDRVAWARRLMEAKAGQPGDAVFLLDNQMVDEPILKQAQHILDLHDRSLAT